MVQNPAIGLIIVDDGSKKSPAYEVIKNFRIKNFELYRITEDLGFNAHGARNLGMFVSRTDWNLLVDIDRHLNDDLITRLNQISQTEENQMKAFFFSVDDSRGRSNNDFFIHKDLYWKLGGYDEEFRNVHHGDRIFFEKFKTFGDVETLPEKIFYTRKGRTVVFSDVKSPYYPDDRIAILPSHFSSNFPRPESSEFDTTTIDGMNAFVEARYQDALLTGKIKNKPVLQFEWDRLI